MRPILLVHLALLVHGALGESFRGSDLVAAARAPKQSSKPTFKPTVKPTKTPTTAPTAVAIPTNSPTVFTFQPQTFRFTGAAQEFTVPEGITELRFDLYGGIGGEVSKSATLRVPGGMGGKVSAVLPVTPGSVYQLYVGGAGKTTGEGGWNGGGVGFGKRSPRMGLLGGGGGGATDIRTVADDLTSRILVAAGGGGGGAATILLGGGAGGGSDGAAGSGDPAYATTPPGGSVGGGGGSQTTGGTAGSVNGNLAQAGSFGLGGNEGYAMGGGGGAGYYGGGGGYYSGAGGGSNFVTPLATTILENSIGTSTSGDGMIVISLP